MSQTAARLRQRRQIEVQRRIAVHAGAGGVDQQSGAAPPPCPNRPAPPGTICASTMGCQRRAPASRRVSAWRLRRWICAAPRSSSARTAPRAAPPAPSSTTVLPFSAAHALAQGFRQADRVGVAAFDPAVCVKDQQIGRARRLRGGIAAMRQGEGRFLVRHRDIDAAKTGAAQAIDHRGEIFPAGPPAAPCAPSMPYSSSQ